MRYLNRKRIIILLILLLLAVLASLFSCAALPFHPSRDMFATPATINLEYEDVFITTSDNEKIHGWYIPAAASLEYQYTLLFFHGNAGNISHRLDSIAIFHDLGLNVFIIDYRGFGLSSGSPSVDGTILDARAAWQWLQQNHLGQIIIFGRSLGGGVAAALAAETSPKALILESTFTSLHAVGKEMAPLLPVSLFLPQDYDTLANLENLRIPLLVVHSQDDEVVAFRLGQAIYDAYVGPKRLLKIGGSHNNGFMQDISNYINELQNFLNDYVNND